MVSSVMKYHFPYSFLAPLSVGNKEQVHPGLGPVPGIVFPVPNGLAPEGPGSVDQLSAEIGDAKIGVLAEFPEGDGSGIPGGNRIGKNQDFFLTVAGFGGATPVADQAFFRADENDPGLRI